MEHDLYQFCFSILVLELKLNFVLHFILAVVTIQEQILY